MKTYQLKLGHKEAWHVSCAIMCSELSFALRTAH